MVIGNDLFPSKSNFTNVSPLFLNKGHSLAVDSVKHKFFFGVGLLNYSVNFTHAVFAYDGKEQRCEIPSCTEQLSKKSQYAERSESTEAPFLHNF